MRTIQFLLEKEFKQIFRNRSILAMIIVMPVVQLILLPLAANYEVSNINLAIVDHDHSTYSQKMISKINASDYFKLKAYNTSFNEAMQLVEVDKADLILEIPSGFERNLMRENREKLLVAINAINGVKANLGGAYLSNIIRDYNNEIRVDLSPQPVMNAAPAIEITSSNWFNVEMNYKLFMVPGILAILITMIGGFLSVLNIVKEKEVGTIEQINVTPIKKHHFILGKLIPFWVLGNIVFTLGLIVSYTIYGIAPAGSLVVLYLFVDVYLLAVLGFGLLVSTFCDTQQQAMFIMFFFMMVFILMGGLFTSTDSMPGWAKAIAKINPVSYLIEVMRMIILKGSEIKNVAWHPFIVSIFAIALNALAVLNYKKTS